MGYISPLVVDTSPRHGIIFTFNACAVRHDALEIPGVVAGQKIVCRVAKRIYHAPGLMVA